MVDDSGAIVRGAIAAWNEEGLDGYLRFIHPDIDWSPDPSWPEAETVHGRDAVRAFLELFDDAWEHVRIAIDELVEVNDGVVGRFRWLLRGRSSGVEQELPVSGVFATRDGLVSEARFFLDHDEALRAAGTETGA